MRRSPANLVELDLATRSQRSMACRWRQTDASAKFAEQAIFLYTLLMSSRPKKTKPLRSPKPQPQQRRKASPQKAAPPRSTTATAKPKKRPRPKKPAGSPATRAITRKIGKLILAASAGHLKKDAARMLGVREYDVKNLLAGNQPSLSMVIRLVSGGRFAPRPLLEGRALQKLPKSVSTRGVQQRFISARIRQAAAQKSAPALAEATGLTVTGIYQLRSGKPAGLHAVLGFMLAGVSVESLFFGA